jgi:multicomponent Na+:H+ antiporter subunit G
MIAEIFTVFFLLTGAFFMLVAALGVVRFPDLYIRMHAASKSISLGIGCMLIGAMFYFGSFFVVLKSIAVVLFIFLTMPVAAHMISRVAYRRQVYIWDKTHTDEMENLIEGQRPKAKENKYNGKSKVI